MYNENYLSIIIKYAPYLIFLYLVLLPILGLYIYVLTIKFDGIHDEILEVKIIL